jgi:hypothetical protein
VSCPDFVGSVMVMVWVTRRTTARVIGAPSPLGLDHHLQLSSSRHGPATDGPPHKPPQAKFARPLNQDMQLFEASLTWWLTVASYSSLGRLTASGRRGNRATLRPACGLPQRIHATPAPATPGEAGHPRPPDSHLCVLRLSRRRPCRCRRPETPRAKPMAPMSSVTNTPPHAPAQYMDSASPRWCSGGRRPSLRPMWMVASSLRSFNRVGGASGSPSHPASRTVCM